MNILGLNSGYTVETDRITKSGWSDSLQRFDDANIYQTWSYGAVRWGESHLSHLLLRKEGEVVAMTQAALFKLPTVRMGVAYITNGPIWRLRGKEENVDHLRQMVKGLREEYAKRRGLLLRVLPNEVEGIGMKARAAMESEGLRHADHSLRQFRTYIVDLAPPVEELRKRLSRRWRKNLSFAESRKIRIVRGTGEDLFEILNGLYQEMVARKGFVPGVDIREYAAIQKDLPDLLKMRIIVCEYEKRPVSALATSFMGNKGIALLAGTATQALELRSSYFMHWSMMEWLKECGHRWYDLGGFDPEKNPGTAFFKAGLPGADVRYLGQFDAAENRLSSFLVTSTDTMRSLWRKMKVAFHRLPKRSNELFEYQRTIRNGQHPVC